jgi:hypothetical protein
MKVRIAAFPSDEAWMWVRGEHLLVVEFTWLIGSNLVWIRCGNFTALFYTVLQETCWRLKTTGERTALLSTVVTLIHSMYTGIFQLATYISILSLFSEQSHSLYFCWNVPSFRRNLLRPSSGLFLFGWEDSVIEFATKLYGVTFQKTVVIFFVWESQGSHTHLVTSFGAPSQISFISHPEGTKYRLRTVAGRVQWDTENLSSPWK